MRTNEDYILKEFKKIKEVIPSLSLYQTKWWCLLSLYRTRQCFFLLSALEECKELSCFDEMLAALRNSLQTESVSSNTAMQKYIDMLDAICSVCAGMFWNEETGEADDLPAAEDKSGAELQEGFCPCHFGNLVTNMTEFLAHSFGLKGGEIHPGRYAELILAATLEDYYYDKYDTGYLGEVREVTAEVERIWRDYYFLLTHPTQAEIEIKIQEYQDICIWK